MGAGLACRGYPARARQVQDGRDTPAGLAATTEVGPAGEDNPRRITGYRQEARRPKGRSPRDGEAHDIRPDQITLAYRLPASGANVDPNQPVKPRRA